MSYTGDMEDRIMGIVIIGGVAVMSLFCGAGILAAVVISDCATVKEFHYGSAFLKRPVSIECRVKEPTTDAGGESGETLKEGE